MHIERFLHAYIYIYIYVLKVYTYIYAEHESRRVRKAKQKHREFSSRAEHVGSPDTGRRDVFSPRKQFAVADRFAKRCVSVHMSRVRRKCLMISCLSKFSLCPQGIGLADLGVCKRRRAHLLAEELAMPEPVEVQQVWSITGGNLGKSAKWIAKTKDVEGKTFVEIDKWDKSLTPFVTGQHIQLKKDKDSPSIIYIHIDLYNALERQKSQTGRGRERERERE